MQRVIRASPIHYEFGVDVTGGDSFTRLGSIVFHPNDPEPEEHDPADITRWEIIADVGDKVGQRFAELLGTQQDPVPKWRFAAPDILLGYPPTIFRGRLKSVNKVRQRNELEIIRVVIQVIEAE